MSLQEVHKKVEAIFDHAGSNAQGDLEILKDPYHRGFIHTSLVFDFCKEHLPARQMRKEGLDPLLIASLLHDIANLYFTNDSHELRLVQEMIDLEQTTNFHSRLNTLILKTYGEVDTKVNTLPSKRIQEELRSILKQILDQYIGKNLTSDWDLIKICILATSYKYMSSLKEEQKQVRDVLLSNPLGVHAHELPTEKRSIQPIDVKNVETLIKTLLDDDNVENLAEHLIFHKGLSRITKTYSEIYHKDHQDILDQIHLIRSSDLCNLFDLDIYNKVEDLLIRSLNGSVSAKKILKDQGYRQEKFDWNLAQIILVVDLYIMHTRLSLMDRKIIQDEYIRGLESVILALTARLWKYAA
jgi:hypothetical protein